MLYDLMPRWLRWALNMDSATLPTNEWTWRHFCRYGHQIALPTEASYRLRRTPWLFR